MSILICGGCRQIHAGQTKANGLVAGTYIFSVTVTDNVGKTDTDDVKIYMNLKDTIPMTCID